MGCDDQGELAERSVNRGIGKIEKRIADYIRQGAVGCKGNDGFLCYIEAFGFVVVRLSA